MTSIVIAPRVEDLTSDTEAVASGGWFRIRPARAYKAGGQWVHPVWPASVTPLNGTAVTVKLDPIADVPYELELSIPDGNGGAYNPPNEFRYVTASASPLNWEDLIQEAGPGVGAPLPGSAEARLLALETLYSTLSGGASTTDGITDMTPVAKLFNKQTTTANMRSYLTAANATHAHVATTDLTATGTKSASTFLRGDDTWATPSVAAGAVDWADVGNKPTTFTPTAQSVTWLTDMTATGEAIAQAASAATVAGLVEPYIQLDAAAPTFVVIYCPGDVDKPRRHPATGAVLPDAPACIVKWKKATFPTVATVYAQNLDEYEPWDG